MTEAAAQLTPGGQNARGVEEAERGRPDDARRPRALLVAIGDGELALFPQRLPQHAQRHRLAPLPARPNDQRVILQLLPHAGRQHGGDFGHGVPRGLGKPLVGAPRHPLRPQRQRLDFGGGQHERRQQEARPQHVAEPRLAVDLRAQGLQRGDVAVKRAERDTGLARKCGSAHRLAVTAERLHQIEQTVRAGHGGAELLVARPVSLGFEVMQAVSRAPAMAHAVARGRRRPIGGG